MNNIVEIGNNAVDILKVNSPKILTGASIITSVGASVATGYATIKAVEEVENIKKDNRNKNVTNKQLTIIYCKRVVPYYIPALLLHATSAACSVSSLTIEERRIAKATEIAASAVAVATASSDALMKYRKKTEELYGKEKAEQVDKEIAKDDISNNPPDDSNIAVIAGKSDLFWDKASNIYFMSTKEDIYKALVRFNNKMQTEMYVSVEEWCDLLDIPTTNRNYLENKIGWSDRYMPMEITLEPCEAPNGRACFAIIPSVPPVGDYRIRY